MVPRGAGVTSFTPSEKRDVQHHAIGTGQHPLIIVDDFLKNPDDLIAHAGSLDGFSSDDRNFYPGVRRPTPEPYAQRLASFLETLLTKRCNVITSMFSIANQDPKTLKPVQSIPHYDTSDDNQFGVVHYLCGPEYGGTSFYRHKATGFEQITDEHKPLYQRTLQREATTSGLPEPGYINGDTDLFERFAQVEAKFNRLIIYPSNLLHAGNIFKVDTGHSSLDAQRLTTTSFIRISRHNP